IKQSSNQAIRQMSKTKMENIRKNIEFSLKKESSTVVDLSNGTDLSRGAIHKILSGERSRVHPKTLQKISRFFGTSCHILENFDLEEMSYRNNLVSVQGNKNPIAIPILTEHELIACKTRFIGDLILNFPIFYHFSSGANIIGLIVGEMLSVRFSRGCILIVERHEGVIEGEANIILREGILVISDIVEPKDYIVGQATEELIYEKKSKIQTTWL
ncbi:hypothetical protein, partial [Vibrio echinoideorum]